MTQHRAALSALLRPEFKPGFGFNRPGFLERYNAILDAAGVPRDEAPVPAVSPPSSDTYDRATARAELLRDEGERLKVYRCTAGKRTIGVGRNLDDVGISAGETRALGITTSSCISAGITRDQSMALLDNDMARVDRDLDRHLPWWRSLDPVRQRILVNMAFNLGIRGLCGFQNSLALVQAGNYEAASVNMLKSLWAKQVGKRAVRLAGMMKTGAA